MIWVRSQDKMRMAYIDGMVIFDFPKGFEIVGYNNKNYTLGVYSTKEKALKVLNALQNFANGIIDSYTSTDYYPKTLKKVFNMPQDDEVQV